jgi:hypothetical protein
MTTFNVSASVQLRGYLDTYSVSDVEIGMSNAPDVDVHDQSVDAGELEARLDVRFTVEADSQDEAEEAADAAFEDMSITSDDNIEWEYESHDVESVEGPPMDKERAKEIVLTFLAAGERLPDEVQEAITFLIESL